MLPFVVAFTAGALLGGAAVWLFVRLLEWTKGYTTGHADGWRQGFDEAGVLSRLLELDGPGTDRLVQERLHLHEGAVAAWRADLERARGGPPR